MTVLNVPFCFHSLAEPLHEAPLDAGPEQLGAKQAALDAGLEQLGAKQAALDAGLEQLGAKPEQLGAGSVLLSEKPEPLVGLPLRAQSSSARTSFSPWH